MVPVALCPVYVTSPPNCLASLQDNWVSVSWGCGLANLGRTRLWLVASRWAREGREGNCTCLPALWYLAALISFLRSQRGISEIRSSRGVPFCSASNSCLIVAPKQIILSQWAEKSRLCTEEVQEWNRNCLVFSLHGSDLVDEMILQL